jgi:Protein of unknown function (DUF2442)
MTEGVPRVREVAVIGAHRLRVSFDDGLVGDIDASGWDWSGTFAPLADPGRFGCVSVDQELGTLVWDAGLLDVAPETLHSLAEQRAVRRPPRRRG